MRKGGLIGLAAMAIGLSKDSGDYVSELVNPVLSCMDDSDSRWVTHFEYLIEYFKKNCKKIENI